jgi:hypothetical protein
LIAVPTEIKKIIACDAETILVFFMPFLISCASPAAAVAVAAA